MARQFNLFDKPDENKNMYTTGGDPNAPAPTQPVGEQKPQGSGRFVNLQNYIKANQGAGEQFAGQLKGNIQSGYNAFKGNIGQQQQQVNKQIQEAQPLYGAGGAGEQFKNKLSGWNTDISGFKGFATPRNFYQAGSQIKQFATPGTTEAPNPQFEQFKNLLGNTAFTGNLGQYQTNIKTAADAQKQNILNQQKNLLTQSGRSDIIAGANRRFGGLTAGSGLNELLFATNKNAPTMVKDLYNQQLSDVNNILSSPTGVYAQTGKSIEDFAKTREDLANALRTGTEGLQASFYNALTNPEVLKEVNKARGDLYTDYMNQLGLGQGAPVPGGAPRNISTDLASLVGLTDPTTGKAISTYQVGQSQGRNQPGINLPPMDSTIPIGRDLAANQLRLYNATGTNPLTAGPEAKTFQDLLNPENYGVLQALAALNLGKYADTKYNVGPSTLGAAVTANDALKNRILAEDKAFREGVGKQYSASHGVDEYGQYPTYGSATANAALENFLASGNQAINTTQNINPAIQAEYGTPGYNDIINRTKAQAESALRDQLYGDINKSGYSNIANITDQNIKEQEKYKRFKGLI